MTDPDLVRVLGRQTPHRVGLLPLPVVRAGAAAVRSRLAALSADGVRHVVVDATADEDLRVLAEAAGDLAVLTGGAGLAGAVGSLSSPGAAPEKSGSAGLPTGPAVVLAGSCSATTLEQVAKASAAIPSYRLDPVATPDPDVLLARATAWLRAEAGRGPVLVHSSAPPADRAAARAAMGPRTAEVLERTLGALAATAVSLGVRRVVVAGGETSGAVVEALGVDSVVVRGEEDRGVPWCVTTGPSPIALLLKSGNFGAPDLLVRAVEGTTP